MKKRLLALLLCLVMVIGLVPFALADGETSGEEAAPAVKTRVINFYSDLAYDNDTIVHTATVNVGDTFTTDLYNTAVTKLPEKEGYSFAGWFQNTDGVKPFYVGDTWPDGSGAKGLYAKWTKNNSKYTVKFEKNANDATGTMADAEWDANKMTSVPGCSFKREGYDFVGWKLNAAGTGPFYYEGDYANFSTLVVNGAVTLYAMWTEKTPTPTTATLTYDVYPGTLKVLPATSYTKAGTITVGTSIILPTDADINYPGYHLEGWYTTVVMSNDDLASYAKYRWTNGAAMPAEDLTLYANFVKEQDSYTVTFNCYNHGKGDDIKVPYGTKLIIDPNYGTYDGNTTKRTITVTSDTTVKDASRYGYSFDGWYVTKDNAGVYTFTAVWNNNYYYNTYSIYYYDYDDCKSEYANFPYGTSVVIDPNGGTAKLSGTSFSTKQSFNIYRDYTLTDASRSGYTFYGWDLTKSGSTYYFTAMWSRYKSDVPYMLNGTDHYAYIKGYPNGSFKPTDTITRAEAATIFYRLLTDSTRKAYATTYNSFKDVPATAWYNTAVSTMAKLGIVNGGADGYFRPNDPITRAEIAAMIARCDGAYYTGTSTVFSDTYGHWAAGYIDRAYELGWINGYGTTYAPDRYISRAETVAVLNRVLNRAPQYTSDLTRNYTTFSDVATSAWYYLDVEEAANSHTYTRKSNADYETWTKLIADPSWF